MSNIVNSFADRQDILKNWSLNKSVELINEYFRYVYDYFAPIQKHIVTAYDYRKEDGGNDHFDIDLKNIRNLSYAYGNVSRGLSISNNFNITGSGLYYRKDKGVNLYAFGEEGVSVFGCEIDLRDDKEIVFDTSLLNKPDFYKSSVYVINGGDSEVTVNLLVDAGEELIKSGEIVTFMINNNTASVKILLRLVCSSTADVDGNNTIVINDYRPSVTLYKTSTGEYNVLTPIADSIVDINNLLGNYYTKNEIDAKVTEINTKIDQAETKVTMKTTIDLGGISANKQYTDASVTQILKDLLCPYVASTLTATPSNRLLTYGKTYTNVYVDVSMSKADEMPDKLYFDSNDVTASVTNNKYKYTYPTSKFSPATASVTYKAEAKFSNGEHPTITASGTIKVIQGCYCVWMPLGTTTWDSSHILTDSEYVKTVESFTNTNDATFSVMSPINGKFDVLFLLTPPSLEVTELKSSGFEVPTVKVGNNIDVKVSSTLTTKFNIIRSASGIEDGAMKFDVTKFNKI